MHKLVRKSHTPIVQIANTYSTGFLHDCRVDNAAADKWRYWRDRRADSLSRACTLIGMMNILVRLKRDWMMYLFSQYKKTATEISHVPL